MPNNVTTVTPNAPATTQPQTQLSQLPNSPNPASSGVGTGSQPEAMKVSQPTASANEPPETFQAKLIRALEKFVKVKDLTNSSSHFRFEGICGKCGWHTMQVAKQSAEDLLRQHVQSHWRDVTHEVT